MANKTDLMKFYDKFVEHFSSLEKNNEFSKHFYSYFLSGENQVYQKFIKETKNFDEEWIKTVESYVPSLNKIVLDPMSNLKTIDEVVLVEKAKKTSSLSVRHLSANTHLIKDVSSSGEVIPKKIMTSYSDINFQTYENRFIMSLIDRLFIFVKSRYDIIKDNVVSYEKRRFHLKGDFPVNETKVDLELNFTLTDELENTKINDYNRKLLERIEYLNKVVISLKTSQFMEMMKGQPKVHPPILKTNVIAKNVEYQNCYMLWLFIDRYNTLAYTIEVEEKNLTFTDQYYKAIRRQVLVIYLSIVANQEKNRSIYQQITPRRSSRKSIKVRRTHPDDLLITPEDKEIADLSLNQYYLEANKRIFKQSIDYYSTTSKTYETTVKRALRDTLQISNALYESFFELEPEQDVFKMLIKGFDLNEELTEAKRKSLVAKMIREVKQVDFNETLAQERRFLDDIVEYTKLLEKEYELKEELAKEDYRRLSELAKTRELALAEKEVINLQLAESKRLKDEVDQHRRDTLVQLREIEKELKEKLDRNLAEYKKLLKEEEKAAVKAYMQKYRPKRRVTNSEIVKEKAKLDADLKVEVDLLKVKYNALFETEKAKLKAESEEILQDKEAFYIQRLEENNENLSELRQLRNQQNLKLSQYEEELKENLAESLKASSHEMKLIQDELFRYYQIKYEIKRRVTNNALQKEIDNYSKNLNRKIAELDEKYQAKLEELKNDLKIKHNETLSKEEETIQNRYKENELNLKKLEQIKNLYQESLAKIEELDHD